MASTVPNKAFRVIAMRVARWGRTKDSRWNLSKAKMRGQRRRVFMRPMRPKRKGIGRARSEGTCGGTGRGGVGWRGVMSERASMRGACEAEWGAARYEGKSRK